MMTFGPHINFRLKFTASETPDEIKTSLLLLHQISIFAEIESIWLPIAFQQSKPQRNKTSQTSTLWLRNKNYNYTLGVQLCKLLAPRNPNVKHILSSLWYTGVYWNILLENYAHTTEPQPYQRSDTLLFTLQVRWLYSNQDWIWHTVWNLRPIWKYIANTILSFYVLTRGNYGSLFGPFIIV